MCCPSLTADPRYIFNRSQAQDWEAFSVLGPGQRKTFVGELWGCQQSPTCFTQYILWELCIYFPSPHQNIWSSMQPVYIESIHKRVSSPSCQETKWTSVYCTWQKAALLLDIWCIWASFPSYWPKICILWVVCEHCTRFKPGEVAPGNEGIFSRPWYHHS